MLDFKNCVATSVVLTTAIYVKPGLKPAKNAGKKYFADHIPPEHEKRRLLRALVDVHVVWPCSCLESQIGCKKNEIV